MKFYGYRRSDGRVGVRNHVVVIPGVLCSSGAAEKIARKVEGTMFVYNPHGCAQTSADSAITTEIISGLIANGNVYGALIVGLGCEQIQKDTYLSAIRKKTDKPVFYISIQDLGGVRKTIEKGIEIASRLVEEASSCQRTECDISELILGLECGGSDPTSGISSNVVLGKAVDVLIDAGGTAVLAETPEAIGAEDILKSRGSTPEVGQKMYDMVKRCEKMFFDYGQDVRKSNPSPGNIKSGITTLEEKSLGCVHKSGTRPFNAAIEYGEMINCRGLVFMDGTAYDVASVVSLVAGGAQVVAFTTGCGTPVGNPIAPVIKITGNRETFIKLNDMIDFDTSGSISGEMSIDELSEKLLDYIIEVCNGEPVKAEINEMFEMAINQFGSYV